MKKRTKILALILAAALSVSVTACGSSDAGNDAANTPDQTKTGQDEASDAAKDDADPFATAKENMKNISSMNAKMTMEMNMDLGANGETQSLQTVTTMDMAYFADPMHLKADVTVDAGETGSTSSTVYAETAEDGTCTMYITDGTNWQSQAVSLDDIAQYDAASSMTEYLENDYPFEAAGTEQVDGANAYKYTATLTGDAVKETLTANGALDSFTSLGIDSAQMESMMDNAGDLPINLWIDEESLYPVKYELDMTSVMDALITGIAESMAEQTEGLTMNIPKMTLSMTCSDYNSAEDFSIPDEAKASGSAAE